MFFRGSKVTLKDTSALMNIDIKSYPFALERGDWEAMINAIDVRLYQHDREPIAYWAGHAATEEQIEDNKSLKGCYVIARFGVMASQQRKGYGTAMLYDVMRHARSWGKDRLVTYLPEYLLDPHFPEYVGAWMAHPGINFRTTGKIEKNALRRYNRDWDIFEYTAEVR